jgi:hypothetical protein
VASTTYYFLIENKTLTFHGTGAGTALKNGSINSVGFFGGRGPNQLGSWNVFCEWAHGSCTVTNGSATISCPSSTSYNLHTVTRAGLNPTLFPSATDDVHTMDVDGCSPGAISQDYGGTWLAEIDVERVYAITITDQLPTYFLERPSVTGLTTLPLPGEVPVYTTWAIVDRLRIGGSASITLTGGGLTSTRTAPIDAYAQSHAGFLTELCGIGANCNASTLGFGVVPQPDVTAETTVTGFFGSVMLAAAYSKSASGPSASIDTAGGAHAVCTATAANSVAEADVFINAQPTRTMGLSGNIYQMSAPSARSVTVSCQRQASYVDHTGVTASFTDNQTQESWATGGNLNSTGQTAGGKNEYASLLAFIQPSSLSGTEPRQNRLLMRAPITFAALSVQQAATWNIDAAPAAGNFVAGAHTVLSGGSPLLIAVSGGSGSFSRTWTAGTGPNLTGYAWLRFRFDPADAGATIKITINGWVWTVTIDSSGFADIDTTALWNAGVSVSAAYTKWPLQEKFDQQGYGIRTMDSLTISQLPTGHTYKLLNIINVRKDHTRLTLLPTTNGGEYKDSTGTGAIVFRGLLAETDGRQSAEIESAQTILGLGQALATCPGWSVTQLAPTTLPFTSATSGATAWPLSSLENNLFGDMTWICSAATLDMDAASALVLNAQPTFDELTAWPSDFTSLSCYAILDGAASGLTFDASGARAAGVAVAATDHTSAAAAGSGTSDGTGQLQTSAPWIPGSSFVDVTAAYAPTPQVAANTRIACRYRHRFAFRAPGVVVTPSGNVIWSLRDYTHRLMVWKTDSGGSLVCRVYDDQDASPVSYTVDGAASCSWPAFHHQGVVIDGTYLQATSAMMARSTTHGRTWTMSTIPNTYAYTALTSAEQRSRLVTCGYHLHNSGIGGDPATDWYVHVGKLNADGSYAWSAAPVAMGLASPTGMAHLRARPDGVLEFIYVDGSGSDVMVRCYQLSLAGAGAWT